MNRCIDVGRQGCPCALAASGHCLVCSKLNGENCDNCGWQGTWIYTLYQQNGHHLAENRRLRPMDIVQTQNYNKDFKVFILQADRGFCQQAALAGAYVFARPEEELQWFDTPISILKSEPDKGLIHLGIYACGPKSTRIFQQTERLLVRGVYHNGLTGLNSLHRNPNKTIIFAKGIAMAPLRNFLDGGQRYTDYLNNLHLYMDLDKVGFDFFRDYFGDLPVGSIKVCSFAEGGLPAFDELPHLGSLNGINIFALTSPYYAEQIQQAASAAGPRIAILRPTEGNFCCGEGICGACTCSDSKGNTIRRCKFAE